MKSARNCSAIAVGMTTTGHDYLAIGAPGEALSFNGARQPDVGVVHVLFTDPATGRLTASGSRYFHQNVPGVKEKTEAADYFGIAVATGNFNNSGNDDLAIGAYGEGVPDNMGHDVGWAGAVFVLYEANTLFTQWFHQNSVDMKDAAEINDYFGMTLGQ